MGRLLAVGESPRLVAQFLGLGIVDGGFGLFANHLISDASVVVRDNIVRIEADRFGAVSNRLVVFGDGHGSA